MSVEVHFRLDGPEDAPALVLSNSLGTTHRMWDAPAATLSTHRRVLRYDTRGHGESPVPPGPYSVETLGRDLLALLDRLELERVSFCGLSIGGMTGMWLAVNAPERVDRLAVCCTAAHLPPREQWIERAALVRSEGVAALADAAIDRWFSPEFRARSPRTVERMRAMLVATPPEGYAACCEALAGFDIRGELGAIAAPTLIVAGADDPVGTPERAREVEAAVAGARLVVLPVARHLAAVEQPRAVARAIDDHLDTAGAAG